MSKDSVPDNHQLHILLTKMDSKIDVVLQGQEDVKTWQTNHEKSDIESFNSLHTRISKLRRYGSSIAIVSGGVAAITTFVFTYIKKTFI